MQKTVKMSLLWEKKLSGNGHIDRIIIIVKTNLTIQVILRHALGICTCI